MDTRRKRFSQKALQRDVYRRIITETGQDSRANLFTGLLLKKAWMDIQSEVRCQVLI